MPLIHEFAPAKLNLYLHITGRQPDGYHMLDSLVAFAGIGDHIKLEPDEDFEFILEGPKADSLRHEPASGNLVVRVAQTLAGQTGRKLDMELTLVKNLPVASGIGGGSSDAAAALRAIAQHWKLSPDDPRLFKAAARHGQDVPVCLKIQNNYITATGTAPAPDLPYADLVMINPNKGLSTVDVYKAYRDNLYSFTPAQPLSAPPMDLRALVDALKTRRNDLYEPACRIMPEIRTIIEALEKTESCLLARMSGSGATCFGIYPDRASARHAASVILRANPDWWVTPTYIPCRPVTSE